MRVLACLLTLAVAWHAIACSQESGTTTPTVDLEAIQSDLVATNRLRWERGIKQLVDGGAAHVSRWSSWLTHENRAVREGVAHALGDIAPQDESIVDALIKAFDDTDDYVRWKAARALGRIGKPAKKALPMLRIAANAEREAEIVRAICKKSVREIEESSR